MVFEVLDDDFGEAEAVVVRGGLGDLVHNAHLHILQDKLI